MSRQPFIRYNTGTGGYTVFSSGRVIGATCDIVEAVELADPEGTGTVQCDEIVRQHLEKFSAEPVVFAEVHAALFPPLPSQP